MDSTPPSYRSEPRLRIKSASRLSRITNFDQEIENTPPSPLSLDLVPSSPNISAKPIHELLLISPPVRKSRTRLAERLDMPEEPPMQPIGSRRRRKNRSGSAGLLGCASPRTNRRSRRRLEAEIMEERETGMIEEIARVRKRRHSGRSKKDKLSLVPSDLPPRAETNEEDQGSLDRIGQMVTDLVMWNDVAKSSLWFGFGSLSFLSSCFARGIQFSIFSLMSQLGLLFLGLSFFSNSIGQRNNDENKRKFKLKEEDILKAARVMLPTVNFAISKSREFFSGEPTMTLKVAALLLIGAEYGHLMTLWRLCALGFFVSFTGPKLYSRHCAHISIKVECLRRWTFETWGACSHKKIVAASAATAFWNLTSIRTRIIAAFLFAVMVRYYRQYSQRKAEEGEAEEQPPEELQKALILVERGSERQ